MSYTRTGHRGDVLASLLRACAARLVMVLNSPRNGLVQSIRN